MFTANGLPHYLFSSLNFDRVFNPSVNTIHCACVYAILGQHRGLLMTRDVPRSRDRFQFSALSQFPKLRSSK